MNIKKNHKSLSIVYLYIISSIIARPIVTRVLTYVATVIYTIT